MINATQKPSIPEGGLLTSREWADFMMADGKAVIDITHGDATIYGVVQNVKLIGSYLYVPRLEDTSAMSSIVAAAKDRGCHWVRTDVASESDLSVLQKKFLDMKSAPHDMQPRENFIIDISGTEEEVMARVKSKARYNIRLAQKKGVEVRIFRLDDEGFYDALTDFFHLVEATEKRKGVRFYDFARYRKMFESLEQETIALYVAQYEGEVIAANIVTFYGGTATYLHGATGERHRNVMAPFLLQWQAILDAKKSSSIYYDFGGYFTVTDDPGKLGISRFKNGFSPTTIPTITQGSYDIIIQSLSYNKYRLLQRVKGFVRL